MRHNSAQTYACNGVERNLKSMCTTHSADKAMQPTQSQAAYPPSSLSPPLLSLAKRTSSMSPISSRMLCHASQPAHCTNTVPRSQATGFTRRVVRESAQHKQTSS